MAFVRVLPGLVFPAENGEMKTLKFGGGGEVGRVNRVSRDPWVVATWGVVFQYLPPNFL